MRTESFDWCRRVASPVLLVTLALFSLPHAASSQEVGQKVRVPTSHANVHMGSGSGQVILVLVAKDTVLPVTGRRGEWIEVELSPELRKTGMVMRWYKNENRGWMHESTVEVVKE